MPADRFLKLHVSVLPEDLDRFSAICWELGTAGLVESSPPGHLEVFFPCDDTSREHLRQLNALADEQRLRIELIDQSVVVNRPQDWLETFRKHFTGVGVGGFWIHPTWEPPSERHSINIVIDPGPAFGTGTHETTQLCLATLEKVIGEQLSILDVGTGSGILTIAAACLRPGVRMVAIDTDPVAAAEAGRNFLANGISAALLAAAPEALRGTFDLVIANLTRTILEAEAFSLTALSRQDLLVSGFNQGEEELVVEAFEKCGTWRRVGGWRLRGWSCLHLQMTTPHSAAGETR